MKSLLSIFFIYVLKDYVSGSTENCLTTGCVGGGMCVDYGSGNYRCSCKVGMVGNETHCVSEKGSFLTGCKLNACVNGQCQEQTDGSAICVCESGNVIDADGKTCIKAVINCPTKPCQDGTCKTETDGTMICVCKEGYVHSATDSTMCIPRIAGSIQEDCTLRPCQYGVCVNTAGVNHCQCIQGYKLSTTDKSLCVPYTQGVANQNPCAHVKCSNGWCVQNAYGNPICRCNYGYQRSHVLQFACVPTRPSCTCHHGQCIQMPNGYQYCKCDSGYQNDHHNPLHCSPIPAPPQTQTGYNNFGDFLSSFLGLEYLLDEM